MGTDGKYELSVMIEWHTLHVNNYSSFKITYVISLPSSDVNSNSVESRTALRIVFIRASDGTYRYLLLRSRDW